jgi:hypothetical protein
MKKLLLVLLFPMLVFGAENNFISPVDTVHAPGARYWSISSFATSDSLTYNATSVKNDTLKQGLNAINATAFNIATGYTGAFWAAAQNTSDTNLISSSFAVNLGTGGRFNAGSGFWKFTGNNKSITFGSTGTTTASLAGLIFAGTNDTLIDNVGFLLGNLIIAPSAIMMNNGSFTTLITNPVEINTNGTLTVKRSINILLASAGKFIKLSTGYVLNGTGPLFMSNNSGSLGTWDTVPKMFTTGTLGLNISQYASGDGSVVLGDSLSCLGTVLIYKSGTGNFNFKTNNNYIGAANFNFGSANATKTCWLSFLSSTINVTGSVNGTLYNTGTIYDTMGTSQFFVGGGWTWPSAHNIFGTATSQLVTFTGVGTTTSNNKWFPGSVVINSAGVTRTFADKFACSTNFTATAGSVLFANKARDSIRGNYANNLTGTDTLNRNSDSLWLGASFTGNLRVKNDLSRTYLYGTALCNFTSNGTTVNYFDIRGDTRAKQMKLIDRYHGRKTVVTTGTLNTNGMDCFSDSFAIINDSVATTTGDTISAPKVTFGLSAKPDLVNPMLLYFGLALKDTLFDTCSRSLGKVVVNKSGDTLTLSGVTHLDTLQVVDGGLRMRSATDTVYVKGLSWTSIIPSTIIAPIVCSGNITFGAGASVAATGAGKIISTLAGATIALNGASVPGITSVRATLEDGGTVNSLTSSANGVKYTLEALKKLTVGTLTIGGTALAPDSLVSSSATDLCTLSTAAGTVCNYTYFKNIYSVNSIIASTGGVNGGGNTNISFPATTSWRSRESFRSARSAYRRRGFWGF